MPAAFLLGGLLCLVAAILLIRRAYPFSHPPGRCPACGYDLAGLPEIDPCPECGNTADSRTRVRAAKRGLFAVLGIPCILLVAAEPIPFIAAMIASSDPGYLGACLICPILPHAVLAVIVWLCRSRLTPRAAVGLTACGLLGLTPSLAIAWYMWAPTSGPPDAFAAIVPLFTCALAVIPMWFGLLIGALLIQHHWFKQLSNPTSPPPPRTSA